MSKATKNIMEEQVRYEDATRELRLAQNNMERATARLALAEEAHEKAAIAFSNAFNSVRSACKVAPLAAR